MEIKVKSIINDLDNYGPNPLQLDCVFLLALHQVLEELPNSLVLLHKFLKYFFNDT